MSDEVNLRRSSDMLRSASYYIPSLQSRDRLANDLRKLAERAVAADDDLLPEEVARRIKRVGELHQRLSCGDGETDLANYLRAVALSAVASLDSNRMHLEFAIAENCVVASRTASFVGLAVNELVMNAVKYAHPSGIAGQLLVGCRRSEHTIIVDVADDGVGLPEGFNPLTGGGFGLSLVRSVAAELKAHLDVVDTGMGLQVRLSIPGDGLVVTDVEFDIEEWKDLTPRERARRCLLFAEQAKLLGANASADVKQACQDLSRHWLALANEIESSASADP